MTHDFVAYCSVGCVLLVAAIMPAMVCRRLSGGCLFGCCLFGSSRFHKCGMSAILLPVLQADGNAPSDNGSCGGLMTDEQNMHCRQGSRRSLWTIFPGYPDGVSRSKDGRSFWVAIVTPPSLLGKMAPYRCTWQSS